MIAAYLVQPAHDAFAVNAGTSQCPSQHPPIGASPASSARPRPTFEQPSPMSFDTTAKVSLTIEQLLDLVDQLSDDDCRKLAAKLEKRGVAVRLRSVLTKLKGAKLDERTIRATTEKVRTRIHGEAQARPGRR